MILGITVQTQKRWYLLYLMHCSYRIFVIRVEGSFSAQLLSHISTEQGANLPLCFTDAGLLWLSRQQFHIIIIIMWHFASYRIYMLYTIEHVEINLHFHQTRKSELDLILPFWQPFQDHISGLTCSFLLHINDCTVCTREWNTFLPQTAHAYTLSQQPSD